MPYSIKITQKKISAEHAECYCNGFHIEARGKDAEEQVKNTCRLMKAFGISNEKELNQFLKESDKKMRKAVTLVPLPEWEGESTIHHTIRDFILPK